MSRIWKLLGGSGLALFLLLSAGSVKADTMEIVGFFFGGNAEPSDAVIAAFVATTTPVTQTLVIDLLEADNSLSDRLIVANAVNDGTPGLSFRFSSDPNLDALPPVPFASTSIPETGSPQDVSAILAILNGGTFEFQVIVASDLDAAGVPEPATLTLAGLGILGAFGYGRIRRRKTAA